MARKIKRRYTVSKSVQKQRDKDRYKSYVRQYKAKAKQLAKKGLTMIDVKLTKREFIFNYQMEKRDHPNNTNIIRDIVDSQAYMFKQSVAAAMRRAIDEAPENSKLATYKNKTLLELRNAGIDLSALNDALKEQHPDWSGSQRSEYISYEVFKSE